MTENRTIHVRDVIISNHCACGDDSLAVSIANVVHSKEPYATDFSIEPDWHQGDHQSQSRGVRVKGVGPDAMVER